ncbi:LLM class flavin-dependent oxidoreductase [Roseibium polysiphoniae]|uniref:LLM class flavin-dependent oxidoreductase n=1 Tax=Roseibium polysiphoniae TaxID=2571221 RepID=UPI003296D8F1
MDGIEFGFFMPPAHNPSINPYSALQDDLALCNHLDELGVDEVWIGEHHSSGWSTLSSPEMFIAAVARETRRIRFATGIIPLPYHHPVHTAERILLLDHLTDGRALLGCGTGTYLHDMEMLGMDPESIRDHFHAALDVVLALIRGETVDTTTPWFTAKKAVLQLRPLRGAIETVVVSSLADEARKLLVDTATSPIVHLTPPWGVIRPGVPPWAGTVDMDPVPSFVERVAAYRKEARHIERIRCCVFVHVSDSVAKGVEELMPGWCGQRNTLWKNVMGLPIPGSTAAHQEALEGLINADTFIVGDVATCTRKLAHLAERIGGPVSLVFNVYGWLSHRATLEQATVIAREVIPNLRGASRGIEESIRLTSLEAARQIKRRSAMQ